jgi:hypothetical protein
MSRFDAIVEILKKKKKKYFYKWKDITDYQEKRP